MKGKLDSKILPTDSASGVTGCTPACQTLSGLTADPCLLPQLNSSLVITPSGMTGFTAHCKR